MVVGCRVLLVSVNCGNSGRADVSMASELEEVAGVFETNFFQCLSTETAQLSVLAGNVSSAPIPPVELDGAADGLAAIFGLGVGNGFGSGSGTGLGDGGFLDGDGTGEAF